MDHEEGGHTRLRARGAASGVFGEVDSLGVSEEELTDELLLESSLLGRLVANCRMEDTRSPTSRCPSLWASCRCLCVRSLAITCDSDMPKACGTNSSGEEGGVETGIFTFLIVP